MVKPDYAKMLMSVTKTFNGLSCRNEVILRLLWDQSLSVFPTFWSLQSSAAHSAFGSSGFSSVSVQSHGTLRVEITKGQGLGETVSNFIGQFIKLSQFFHGLKKKEHPSHFEYIFLSLRVLFPFFTRVWLSCFFYGKITPNAFSFLSLHSHG